MCMVSQDVPHIMILPLGPVYWMSYFQNRANMIDIPVGCHNFRMTGDWNLKILKKIKQMI